MLGSAQGVDQSGVKRSELPPRGEDPLRSLQGPAPGVDAVSVGDGTAEKDNTRQKYRKGQGQGGRWGG